MTISRSPAQPWAQHAASPGNQLLLLIPMIALTTLTPLAAAAIPFQQAPVDWTLVPDKPEAAANLSTNCICALLNGTCTPGCCCDTACPTELIQGFRDAGQCLPEGTPPQQLPFCIPAEPFAKVRLAEVVSAKQQAQLVASAASSCRCCRRQGHQTTCSSTQVLSETVCGHNTLLTVGAAGEPPSWRLLSPAATCSRL